MRSISSGSWQPGRGLITWRNAAACGKAPVGDPGSQEHGWHAGQEMPCMVPVLLGITGGRAGHIGSCHTNTCVLRHLPRNITDAPQHPVISHLGSTCCKPLSSSRGMMCAHMLSRYHRRHFSRQQTPPSWVCYFPPAPSTAFPCLSSGRCSAVYSTVLGHLIACFEGLELNLLNKHNIIVFSNGYNRQ